jgi:hypothetical protein
MAGANKAIAPVLKVGWWVAVVLKPDTAPFRCYVGKIEALDTDGMRLGLIDWVVGDPVTWDFYIPHRNVESALLCTEEHDKKGFGEAAGKWQETMQKSVATKSD